MINLTELRIRHGDYADSLSLGEVKFRDDALTEAIALVKRWGIYLPDPGMEYHGSDADVCGQFVVDHDKGVAFFELIINDEE